MSSYVEQLKEREKYEKYKTDRLGAGTLMSIQSHVNSSRLHMMNHQIGHAVNIVDAEPPLVATGFEAVFGQFSGMILKVDTDEEIIYKIERNMFNYILITYSKSLKRFNVYRREEIEEHSEGFCTKFKNTYMDSLDVGDVIPNDETLVKSDSFDKHMNYCLGKNLNTLYMISVNTMEDQIIIMNDADKKLETYMYETRVIPINDNDVLLNLYGDDDHYQAMPGMGKKVKNGILMAIRQIDNSKAPYALKKKHLARTEAGDRIYYGDGKIIDVKVYYNKDKSKLIESPTNVQVNEYYLGALEFYRDVYEALSRIIENAVDDGYTYADDLTIMYREAKDYLDASAYYSDMNGRVFGNLLLVVKLLKRAPLVNGSKLVGRAGNKGIVSIVPKKDGYISEDGRPVEVIMDALGIVGRLNPSILNEHALTAAGDVAREQIAATNDIEEKTYILYALLKLVNPEEYQHMKAYMKMLSKSQKEVFFDKVVRNGIYLIQDPIENCNLYDYEKIMEKFSPKYTRIVFPDGSKSLRRAIISPQYYMRLKQDPIEKFSARGRGMINPLYLLPTKSALKKMGMGLYSDIAVRLGEYEIDLMGLTNVPELVSDFMAENSTKSSAKEELSKRYVGDLNDTLSFDDAIEGTKKNREIIDGYLEVLGSELVFEYEEDEKSKG